MDIRKREIRRILSGFSYDDGEKIRAANNLLQIDIQGSFTGSFTARLLGLTVAKRQYKFKVKPDEVNRICGAALREMGRAVSLETAPDALAAVFYPYYHNAFVMTVDMEGSQALVQYYTARTVPSLLFSRLYFRKWEKHMPAGEYERNELITMTPQLIAPEKEKTEEKAEGRSKQNNSEKKNNTPQKTPKPKKAESKQKKRSEKRRKE